MVQAMIGFYTLNNKQALTSFKVRLTSPFLQSFKTTSHSYILQAYNTLKSSKQKLVLWYMQVEGQYFVVKVIYLQWLF